jgi:hypothetical protein
MNNRDSYDDVNFDQSYQAQREVHPAGLVKAVCVDVIDLPHQKNRFFDPSNEKSKEFNDQLKLVWETAKRKKNGKPFTISRTFSKSLYDGAAGGNASGLFKILSSWFGPEFNGKFEAKRVAGRPALLIVRHEVKDGVTKAKLDNVLADESDPYVADGLYKRFVDRNAAPAAVAEEDEEGTPF